MGFAGDGKTFTATEVAIGLIELMRQRGIEHGDRPAMFLDTETGSDWVKPRFDASNIELFTAKTRAMPDLKSAIIETEQSGSVLIIDSITHFWTTFTEEYAERRNRKRGLEFADWAFLKAEWRKFTDLFVNSQAHIILCGRAGYEYDFFEDDNGKRQLAKTGVKMKAEGETGYEPSILVQMEKHRDLDTGRVWRTAFVIKDRSTRIDGMRFENPTFNDFRPHIEFLNIGGKHTGVDTTRDNGELFSDEGVPRWIMEKRAKEIALDEIGEVIGKHYPGSTADMKKAKGDLLEEIFGTRSWERIKTFDWPTIQIMRESVWQKLEGQSYRIEKSVSEEEHIDDLPQ
jgi:hypothetical protein